MLLASNLIAVVAVIAIVLYGSTGPSQAAQNAIAPTSGQAVNNPLDQLSSADIAVTMSQAANLPEATAVRNQADTVNAESTVTASASLVAKPQIVATGIKSRSDIHKYSVQSGDTVTSIAAKFNVTSDSIRWSNSLSSDNAVVGSTLEIPPINGIVYTVQSGDTAQSLANKYNTQADQITAFNDAEISGLYQGERIVIPNGQIKQAVYTASTAASYGFAFGTSAIYGSNGYDWGFCTWYVATRVSVPSNWGNASTWATLAALSGWTVSSVPRQGAIAQTPYAAGGEGHVAYVEAVSADGSQIKISDMNGIAGFARVGYSDWMPASRYPHYIYR